MSRSSRVEMSSGVMLIGVGRRRSIVLVVGMRSEVRECEGCDLFVVWKRWCSTEILSGLYEVEHVRVAALFTFVTLGAKASMNLNKPQQELEVSANSY